jgi:hypothetical protein
MPKIPFSQFIKTLFAHAQANNLVLDIRRFNSIQNVYQHYTAANNLAD